MLKHLQHDIGSQTNNAAWCFISWHPLEYVKALNDEAVYGKAVKYRKRRWSSMSLQQHRNNNGYILTHQAYHASVILPRFNLFGKSALTLISAPVTQKLALFRKHGVEISEKGINLKVEKAPHHLTWHRERARAAGAGAHTTINIIIKALTTAHRPELCTVAHTIILARWWESSIQLACWRLIGAIKSLLWPPTSNARLDEG